MFRIFNSKPTGTRTRSRPKFRWTDCLEDDFKVLTVTKWRTVAKLRSDWKRVFEKALAHPGLLSGTSLGVAQLGLALSEGPVSFLTLS
ncbi:hypothetical protein TNCV_1352711 [Trichonephila clavipes]|nr:hypothetical protein TNCV_1352711 [Trichonephila clavipes]